MLKISSASATSFFPLLRLMQGPLHRSEWARIKYLGAGCHEAYPSVRAQSASPVPSLLEIACLWYTLHEPEESRAGATTGPLAES